jgi:hypothetical protein
MSKEVQEHVQVHTDTHGGIAQDLSSLPTDGTHPMTPAKASWVKDAIQFHEYCLSV